LDRDIAAMPESHSMFIHASNLDLHADSVVDTIVGSRGISLSGGQKQRVALARAVYSKNELMVIDDGFSGLDVKTVEMVFSNLFAKQGLLKRLGTTVILVTHAVHRLPYADHILSLNTEGQIGEQGTFDQLKNSSGYVSNLAIRHKHEQDSTSAEAKTRIPSPETWESTTEHITSQAQTEEEDLNRPIGEWSTYRYYFMSIGLSRSLLSLFYLTLSGSASMFTELLVTYWTAAISKHGNGVNALYLGIFGLLAAIATIFYIASTFHYFLCVVPGSSEELHARLLKSVMNAPLYFFTSIDTGVTTNR